MIEKYIVINKSFKENISELKKEEYIKILIGLKNFSEIPSYLFYLCYSLANKEDVYLPWYTEFNRLERKLTDKIHNIKKIDNFIKTQIKERGREDKIRRSLLMFSTINGIKKYKENMETILKEVEEWGIISNEFEEYYKVKKERFEKIIGGLWPTLREIQLLAKSIGKNFVIPEVDLSSIPGIKETTSTILNSWLEENLIKDYEEPNYKSKIMNPYQIILNSTSSLGLKVLKNKLPSPYKILLNEYGFYINGKLRKEYFELFYNKLKRLSNRLKLYLLAKEMSKKLSSKKIAKNLKLNEQTVKKWLKEGYLPIKQKTLIGLLELNLISYEEYQKLIST